MEWSKRMDMVDAWSPAEESIHKNQSRVTARGSLHFGKRGKFDDASRNLWVQCPPGVGAFSHPCRGIQPLSDGKRKRIPPN
ncbi:hypothetical protein TNCV_1963701 [Trichonephila clavipes]|nr:hypothetical protein TNCV_1963701 [Trichonephila clavipes]